MSDENPQNEPVAPEQDIEAANNDDSPKEAVAPEQGIEAANDENSPKETGAPEQDIDASNSPKETVAPEQNIDAANDDDSPKETVEPEQDAQDIDTTPAQAEPPKPAVAGGAWSMPEPVFKQTSGYLPQGFEKQFEPAPKGNEDTTAEQSKPEFAQPQAADAESAEMPVVEPQPDVLEDGLLESAEFSQPSLPSQKKGIVGRILMILLALIIVVMIAAVLVAAVGFVLWPRPDSTIN